MNEITKLIKLSGLSQKELSVIFNTPGSRISEYKNGKHEITVKKLKEWCKLLNIDIKELF